MWLPWAIGGAGIVMAMLAGLLFLPGPRRRRLEYAFHRAVFRGDVPRVRRMLARGLSLDWPEFVEGTPPLHAAVSSRSAAMVRELVAAGADIEATGHMGFTPLQDACSKGLADTVRLLLSLGARMDYPPRTGSLNGHPMGMAVVQGYADVVQALLDAGIDANQPIDEAGRTALGLALALRGMRCQMLVYGPGDTREVRDDQPLPADMADSLNRIIAVLRTAGARE